MGGSGTLAYTAPEAWEYDPKTGRLRSADRAVDQWALGESSMSLKYPRLLLTRRRVIRPDLASLVILRLAVSQRRRHEIAGGRNQIVSWVWRMFPVESILAELVAADSFRMMPPCWTMARGTTCPRPCCDSCPSSSIAKPPNGHLQKRC